MQISSPCKFIWVSLLYFAQGFPYGIIMKLFPVYFRHELNLPVVDIGLISVCTLAWTLKFLWAPLLDAAPNRRYWIAACQILMGACLAVLLITDAGLFGIAIILCSMALFSATQDIAIDAYTIELLSPREVGPANGLRVAFYRVALIAAGGWFIALADPDEALGWKAVIALAAGTMLLLSIVSLFIPRIPPLSCNRSVAAIVGSSIRQFLTTPGFIPVLFFILTFKLGDRALDVMSQPFWVDQKYTLSQIGLITGSVSVVFAIAGAVAGGWFTRWAGIFPALWILGLLQAVSNLVYARAAALEPSVTMMYAASIVESFCGGLGTAPFLAFLMTICAKEYAATQYALLSALYGLTGTIVGAFSGFAVKAFGYSDYFLLTFALALPAFALLPRMKNAIKNRSGGAS